MFLKHSYRIKRQVGTTLKRYRDFSSFNYALDFTIFVTKAKSRL